MLNCEITLKSISNQTLLNVNIMHNSKKTCDLVDDKTDTFKIDKAMDYIYNVSDEYYRVHWLLNIFYDSKYYMKEHENQIIDAIIIRDFEHQKPYLHTIHNVIFSLQSIRPRNWDITKKFCNRLKKFIAMIVRDDNMEMFTILEKNRIYRKQDPITGMEFYPYTKMKNQINVGSKILEKIVINTSIDNDSFMQLSKKDCPDD